MRMAFVALGMIAVRLHFGEALREVPFAGIAVVAGLIIAVFQDIGELTRK